MFFNVFCDVLSAKLPQGMIPLAFNQLWRIVNLRANICLSIQNIWLCLQDVLSVRLLQGTVWFSVKLEVLNVRFGDVLSVRIAPGINLVFSKLCSKCMSVTIYIYIYTHNICTWHDEWTNLPGRPLAHSVASCQHGWTDGSLTELIYGIRTLKIHENPGKSPCLGIFTYCTTIANLPCTTIANLLCGLKTMRSEWPWALQNWASLVAIGSTGSNHKIHEAPVISSS